MAYKLFQPFPTPTTPLGYHDSRRVKVELEAQEKEVTFKLPQPEPLRYQGPALQLRSAGFMYAGSKSSSSAGRHMVVDGVTLDASASSRIGLIGANGAGKVSSGYDRKRSSALHVCLGPSYEDTGWGLLQPQVLTVENNLGQRQLWFMSYMLAARPQRQLNTCTTLHHPI